VELIIVEIYHLRLFLFCSEYVAHLQFDGS